MRYLLPLLALGCATQLPADEPPVVAKPDLFKTLVNPNCSHCVDEAKRRAGELNSSDPVLVWTRGYSDGGAIPLRFFLNTYRVISDSYGVFVYDPDAGFARGFAPSYNFTFHGWRNGVMVMKHKDGTLYSCLSGVAFDGPRKGDRLKPIPTLTSDWGTWMGRYPNAVTYQMFEKYKPVELPKGAHPDSVKSRPAKTDPRMKPESLVIGVRLGDKTKAYEVKDDWNRLENHVFWDEIGGEKVLVIWERWKNSAGVYRPIAHQPRKWKAPEPDKEGVSPPDVGVPLSDGAKELPPRKVSLMIRPYKGSAGVLTEGTDGTNPETWDIAGRCTNGELKGWTLEPVESVVCKWFAWSAEYPSTEVHGVSREAKPSAKADADKEIAGTSEFLRVLPKPFATLKAIDTKARTVTLLLDGEKTAKVWPLEPDAEVKVGGWWGRLDQFKPEQRVWAWLKLDRKKNPVSVALLADGTTEQNMHLGVPWLVTAVDANEDSVKDGGELTFTLTAGEKKQTLKGMVKDMALVAPGTRILIQSDGQRIARFAWADRIEEAREAQQAWLRQRWIDEGLPGTLTFHHVFSGELELMLDHEAMRWGRSLKAGDAVSLTADPPIKAVVRSVTPWRERTLVRLVVGELESSELRIGQRLNLKMPPPADESSPYPLDIGRPRTPAERVEWFLASTYCVCPVGKDTCTGHAYTLASCNPNGCAAPTSTRKKLRELIDAGKTDREIWDELLKARGPLMTRPHLKP